MQSPKNENNKKNIYDTLTVENIKEFIYDNAITVENIKNLLQDETKIKDKILLKLLKNYVHGEKMKKYYFITGIPHCAYFNIYNKHITLISDFHYREDANDFHSENQISVTNFFKEYLSTNINVIDFFIETSPYMLDRLIIEDEKTQLSEEQDYTNSEMLRFVGEFKDCFQKKNCSGRFHYIDRRDEYKIPFEGNEDLLDEKYNKAYHEYTTDIRKFLDTKDIVKNMFIFNLIIKHYYSLLEYLSKDDRDTDILGEISNRILFLCSMFQGDLEIYFKYDVPKLIKLDKQLYYINNDKIRDELRKTYTDTIEQYKLYKLVEQQTEQLQNIDWNEVSIDFIENLFGNVLEPFSFVNDIYTLSRIFRIFKDGTSVRNAVVFAGKAHIDNIVRILNRFCENQEHYYISVGSPEYKIPIDIFKSLYNLTNN